VAWRREPHLPAAGAGCEASAAPDGRHAAASIGFHSFSMASRGHAMQRSKAIFGSAIFFVLVPCVFAGVIPW